MNKRRLPLIAALIVGLTVTTSGSLAFRQLTADQSDPCGASGISFEIPADWALLSTCHDGQRQVVAGPSAIVTPWSTDNLNVTVISSPAGDPGDVLASPVASETGAACVIPDKMSISVKAPDSDSVAMLCANGVIVIGTTEP